MAGPVLAGWLVDGDFSGTGWRMIFLINRRLPWHARSDLVERETKPQLPASAREPGASCCSGLFGCLPAPVLTLC